jgi:hypothetical protein
MVLPDNAGVLEGWLGLYGLQCRERPGIDSQGNHLVLIRLYCVEGISLDGNCTAFALAPDFDKIDAETADPQISRGSRHTLARYGLIIVLRLRDDAALSFVHGSVIREAGICPEHYPLAEALRVKGIVLRWGRR